MNRLLNLKAFAALLVATALITTLLSGCGTTHEPQPVSLFNGVDLTGWHMDVPAMDQNPDTTRPFIVRDSMLVSLGTPGGHLITDSLFSNYRLEVEYRFAGVPGNCGCWCTLRRRGPCTACSPVRWKCR
jgi:hypothetical protein